MPFFQLVSRLLAAGADPNLANLSGFTALDVSLGAARRTLEAVTTHLTDPALLQVFVWPSLTADALQGVEALARSLTPDKLSALRSGAGLGGLRRTSLEPSGALRRPSLEPSGGLRRPSNHIGHSPFASLNSSPIRRLSIHRRSSR